MKISGLEDYSSHLTLCVRCFRLSSAWVGAMAVCSILAFLILNRTWSTLRAPWRAAILLLSSSGVNTGLRQMWMFFFSLAISLSRAFRFHGWTVRTMLFFPFQIFPFGRFFGHIINSWVSRMLILKHFFFISGKLLFISMSRLSPQQFDKNGQYVFVTRTTDRWCLW